MRYSKNDCYLLNLFTPIYYLFVSTDLLAYFSLFGWHMLSDNESVMTEQLDNKNKFTAYNYVANVEQFSGQ